ncbi:hypothetical protein V6N13_059024 [Hibiscus sabdariffa]
MEVGFDLGVERAPSPLLPLSSHVRRYGCRSWILETLTNKSETLELDCTSGPSGRAHHQESSAGPRPSLAPSRFKPVSEPSGVEP